jgi:hypothetical protein
MTDANWLPHSDMPNLVYCLFYTHFEHNNVSFKNTFRFNIFSWFVFFVSVYNFMFLITRIKVVSSKCTCTFQHFFMIWFQFQSTNPRQLKSQDGVFERKNWCPIYVRFFLALIYYANPHMLWRLGLIHDTRLPYQYTLFLSNDYVMVDLYGQFLI